ncbi:MAG: hypothetical protein ACLQJR_16260 [Stellaceae bacterium]
MLRLSPALLLAALALGACTTAPPSGPSLVATAGKDKSVATFRQDDADCRQVAAQRIAAGAPTQPAEGAPAAAPVAGTPQQRYDASYAQCMCAKGDTIERRYGAYPLVFIGLLSSVGMGAAGHGSGNH